MKINTFDIKKYSQILIFVPLIILVFTLIILNDGSLAKKHTSDLLLTTFATKIIDVCDKERYHPACYDREIPKLMEDISMEDAFKVTAIIQAKDSAYPFCHVLAHTLTGIEVDKDPSKWKDVAIRAPTDMCSNGGLHGAFQQRFRAENMSPEQIEEIKPELETVCEKRMGWDPTSLERGACYHALGHLTMYLTKADAQASVKLCDEIGLKIGGNIIQSCYDGVFMQIFQPLEPEDFALIEGMDIKINAGNLQDFCGQFHGKQRASCWAEGWPLFREKVITPKGLNEYCGNDFLEDNESKERCYTGEFYMIMVELKFDMSKYKNFCSELPASVSGLCVNAGATRLITTDYRYFSKAADFCSSVNRVGDKNGCYAKIVEYALYNFHSDSKESKALCNTLPENWRNKCLGGVRN